MRAEIVEVVADLPRDVVAHHGCTDLDGVGDPLRVRAPVALHDETVEAEEDRTIVVVRIKMDLQKIERRLRKSEARFGTQRALERAAQQVAGMKLFFGKARCDACHEGINFTTNAYHNLGIGTDKPKPDEGRFIVTKNPADWGAFKTPTLREAARTAPYTTKAELPTRTSIKRFAN